MPECTVFRIPTASTNIQNVGVRMASEAIKSGSPACRIAAPWPSNAFPLLSSTMTSEMFISSSGIGSPSGRSPMLSGSRRIRKDTGMTTEMIITPDMKAAGRQPALRTKKPISGAIVVPPIAVPIPASPIARPR